MNLPTNSSPVLNKNIGARPRLRARIMVGNNADHVTVNFHMIDLGSDWESVGPYLGRRHTPPVQVVDMQYWNAQPSIRALFTIAGIAQIKLGYARQ